MPTTCRFVSFVNEFKDYPDEFQKKLSGNGSFDYSDIITELEVFSNKANLNLFIYLFEQHLGEHLCEKFMFGYKRNLLSFLSSLSAEHRFFILYEIKTNKTLYAYC